MLQKAALAKENRDFASCVAQRPPAQFLRPAVRQKARPVIWRSADAPMTGTIYRLPDDMTLQRGYTYTYLPDGRAMRVPSMNRLQVRAAAEGHQENENTDIVEALQQLITGKRKTGSKASFDPMGRANKQAADARNPVRGPPERVQGQGIRPMPVQFA